LQSYIRDSDHKGMFIGLQNGEKTSIWLKIHPALNDKIYLVLSLAFRNSGCEDAYFALRHAIQALSDRCPF
jgi:hypothetical protein